MKWKINIPEAEFLLDLDSVLNLLVDELVVCLLADLALGKLVTLDTNLLGLGERSDSGGREKGEVEGLLLLSVTLVKGSLAVVHLGSNLGLTVLNLGVIGAGRLSTRLHGGGIGIELGTDRVGVADGLGEDGDVTALLNSEGEPVVNLLGEFLLASEGMGDVEKGTGGSNDNTLRAEGLGSFLEELQGVLEVVLPDVPAVNDTSGCFQSRQPSVEKDQKKSQRNKNFRIQSIGELLTKDLVGSKAVHDSLELLGVADKIDMETLKAGEGREDV